MQSGAVIEGLNVVEEIRRAVRQRRLPAATGAQGRGTKVSAMKSQIAREASKVALIHLRNMGLATMPLSRTDEVYAIRFPSCTNDKKFDGELFGGPRGELGGGSKMSPKTVGLIVFNEMAWAEFGGALETFTQAHIPTDYGYGCRCYNVVTIGLTSEPCLGAAGLVVKPDVDFRTAPELDTLVVCGGEAMRAPTLSKKVAKWLTYRGPTTRRIAALGTGIYPLAMTGLLDRREVATHWRFAKDVAIRFPGLRVHPNRLYVKDGPFYTCAGGTSAVDFSLSLVEADFGRSLALKLARDLVVHSQRTGGEEQYSEPLQFQVRASDRYHFAELASWILSHLGEDLTVDALARRACMSPRNFARLFTQTFGKTPAEFVAGARMTEARRRLLLPRTTLKDVAASLGYKSAAVFSGAFERFVGMRPGTYRARLGVSGEVHGAEEQSAARRSLLVGV